MWKLLLWWLSPWIAVFVAGWIAAYSHRYAPSHPLLEKIYFAVLITVFLACWLYLCGFWGMDWIGLGADPLTDGP